MDGSGAINGEVDPGQPGPQNDTYPPVLRNGLSTAPDRCQRSGIAWWRVEPNLFAVPDLH